MYLTYPRHIEAIPYNGLPKRAFVSISFRSKSHDTLSSDDFFSIRDALLPYVASLPVEITLPLGFSDKRQRTLLICFEAPVQIKSLIEEYVHTAMQLDSQYSISITFAEL
jgi:hypothetical protein